MTISNRRLCNSCELIYSNVQHFNSIIADSSYVTFQQVITFGCLSKFLTWAKAKQQFDSEANCNSFIKILVCGMDTHKAI